MYFSNSSILLPSYKACISSNCVLRRRRRFCVQIVNSTNATMQAIPAIVAYAISFVRRIRASRFASNVSSTCFRSKSGIGISHACTRSHSCRNSISEARPPSNVSRKPDSALLKSACFARRRARVSRSSFASFNVASQLDGLFKNASSVARSSHFLICASISSESSDVIALCSLPSSFSPSSFKSPERSDINATRRRFINDSGAGTTRNGWFNSLKITFKRCKSMAANADSACCTHASNVAVSNGSRFVFHAGFVGSFSRISRNTRMQFSWSL